MYIYNNTCNNNNNIILTKINHTIKDIIEPVPKIKKKFYKILYLKQKKVLTHNVKYQSQVYYAQKSF